MPAIVYLVLAVITTLMMILEKFKLVPTLIKIIFIIIWTWVLNLICNAGYEWLSWVLVLLPFLIILILMLIAYSTIMKYLIEKKEYRYERRYEPRRRERDEYRRHERDGNRRYERDGPRRHERDGHRRYEDMENINMEDIENMENINMEEMNETFWNSR
jgi:predicted membrane protein